jgi:hypothetical protein
VLPPLAALITAAAAVAALRSLKHDFETPGACFCPAIKRAENELRDKEEDEMTRLLASVMAIALAALLVPATGSPSAQETRPHSATCVAVPDDPLSPVVHATGTCQATHLGRDRFESRHTLVPTGPPDANGVLPLAIVGGAGTHRSASGDELSSLYEGTGSVNLVTGRIEFELQGRYTGGTGRFAGASGTTRISGVVEDGVARFTEEGSITY